MGINLYTTDKTIGNREDLTDILTNISPTETPFISSIGRVSARSVLHEWQTDTLSDVATNSQDEGFSATNASAGVTTRLGNRTQIFSKVVMVSNTELAMNPAGRDNEYSYQLQKRTKELARDLESACLVQSAQSSGEATAGTARLMEGLGLGGTYGSAATAGLGGWISANYYVGTALGLTAGGNNGVSAGSARFNLTETLLNNLFQVIWEQGGAPDMVFANGYLRRVISGFTTNNTRFQTIPNSNSEVMLNGSVDVYRYDFGVVSIKSNRYMSNTQVAAVQTEYFKLAELRGMNFKELATDGDRTRGLLTYEATLAAYAPRTGGVIRQVASALGGTASD